MFEFFKKFFSSPKHGLGAEPNPLDLRDIQIATIQPLVVEKIPLEYITDISAIPVTNQLEKGTCVAQAEGSVIAFFDNLENHNVDVSRRFIYGKAKLIDGIPNLQGTYPRVASSILANIGVTTSAFIKDDNTLPYGEYVALPSDFSAMLDDAKRRRANYVSVPIDFDHLRQAIVKNKVITISLYVDYASWQNGQLTPPKNIIGLHRVLLYGFSGRTFYGRNSWGENWGNKGNFSFNFDEYLNYMMDALAYTDIPNEILKQATDQTYTFTKTMKIGDTGPEIQKLQKFLGVTQTGYFGPVTKKYVVNFQIANGLKADGIVGPKTLEKLNKPIFMMTPLELAIMKVESGGDLYAIGDVTLQNKAYGCMQIRQGVCDELNAYLGTKIKSEQMLGNLNLSIYVFREYQKKVNPNGTDEEKSKTWNGGSGWKQRIGKPQYANYNKKLDEYWSAVKAILAK